MIFFKRKVAIPKLLNEFNQVFEKAGFEAYLVGGAVRDIFLKKTASDWDVTTNARPEEVMKLFKFVIPTGIDHGTVTVHFKNHEIEVTTFRTESDYSDGRHPDKIEYAGHIEEDLSRRDLTINAIAVSLKDGKIIDPFGGRKDIRKKIIRTVGNPKDRFTEDGLRPIRALRFSSQLNFKIQPETYKAIADSEVQTKIHSISVERFRDELLKMLKSEKPSVGLKLMEETGILNFFIPELASGRNCIQNDDRGFHVFDVLDHNYYACDGASKDNYIVRLAALFHDIGKPESKTEKQEDGLTIFNFFNHEKYSEKITRKIMTNLKFSNTEIDKVCHLIVNHMFHYEPNWTDAAIRRFLVRVGYENVDDLIDLRLADMYGKYNEPVRLHDSAACDVLIEFKERIEKIHNENNALSLRDLAVNGKDLIAAGIPAGKQLGIILNQLLDCVLEDPQMNDKDILLKLALNIYADA